MSFLDSVARCDTSELSTLLGHVDLQERNHHNYNALHVASMRGDKDICSLLVDAGIEIDVVGDDGYTALRLAVDLKSVECVRFLAPLVQPLIHDLAWRKFDHHLSPLLHCAAEHSDLFEILFDSGFKPSTCDSNNNTLFHICARQNNSKTLTFLLNRGATEGVNSRTRFCKTALEVAVERRHVTCVRLLLQLGADANARTSDGNTLLMTSNVDCARLLLDFGARIDDIDVRCKSALLKFVDAENDSMVRFLLERGANVQSSCRSKIPCHDLFSRHPLVRAACHNSIDILRILCTSDFDKRLINIALQHAVSHYAYDTTVYLLDTQGADVRSAQMLLLNQLPSWADLVIKHNVDLTLRTRDGDFRGMLRVGKHGQRFSDQIQRTLFERREKAYGDGYSDRALTSIMLLVYRLWQDKLTHSPFLSTKVPFVSTSLSQDLTDIIQRMDEWRKPRHANVSTLEERETFWIRHLYISHVSEAEPLLALALKNCMWDAFEALVLLGVDVNDGHPLFSVLSRVECVRLLVEKGADVMRMDTHNVSLLERAVQSEFVDSIPIILKHSSTIYDKKAICRRGKSGRNRIAMLIRRHRWCQRVVQIFTKIILCWRSESNRSNRVTLGAVASSFVMKIDIWNAILD